MSWMRGWGARAADAHDPQVCYQTFAKHWQQALHIMTQSGGGEVQQDDVLGVVSHVEQTATLLALESRAAELRAAAEDQPTSCFRHLINEDLLGRLYSWSKTAGKYRSALMVIQLRVVEAAVRAHGAATLRAGAVRGPLLRLLRDITADLQPHHVQEAAVSALGAVCVALVQNIDLLPHFLPDHTDARCDLAEVLLSAVHAEGGAGSAARDSLLLVFGVSARCERLERALSPPSSHACFVLATGLSGLYSLLPRTLPATTRLTPDHVAAIPKLSLFVDGVMFCDGVARVCGRALRRRLLELVVYGFLAPVLGGALLAADPHETAAAVLYTELVVRCTSSRGLLRAVLRFLTLYDYGDARPLPHLAAAIPTAAPPTRPTLALVDTVIDLNCEDVVILLLLNYLPQTTRSECVSVCRWAAPALLQLAPAAPAPSHDSLLGDYAAYARAARIEVETRAAACAGWRLVEPAPGVDSITSSGYCSLPHHETPFYAEETYMSELALSPPPPPPPAPPPPPLLGALLTAASSLLACDLGTLTLLTGVLSKLVALPTPSVCAAVLAHAVPLLRRLRREADEVTRSCSDAAALQRRARDYLVRREESACRRREPPPPRAALAGLANMFGARRHSAGDDEEAWWRGSASRRAVLNALLLGEWCRELAALAAEQALHFAAPPAASPNAPPAATPSASTATAL